MFKRKSENWCFTIDLEQQYRVDEILSKYPKLKVERYTSITDGKMLYIVRQRKWSDGDDAAREIINHITSYNGYYDRTKHI